MERHPEVELISSARLHRGRAFEVFQESFRLPSGRRLEALVVDQPHGAVAVAARLGGGELLLVRQYRHALGDWLVELPAGRIDPGESPLEAARRELEEEAGHRAARWTELGTLALAPALCSERMTLFLAEQLEPAGEDRLQPDADEELELVRARPAELLAGGTIDAKTLLAAAWLTALGSRRPDGDGTD